MKIYVAPFFKTDRARLILGSLRYGTRAATSPVLDYSQAGRWFTITGDPASVEDAASTLLKLVGGKMLL
jgi:hypothetical protein